MEWSLNPLVAIGVALAVMFFGYGFGLFEGRSQGYKNRKKEEVEEKKHQPAPVASVNPPTDETPLLNVSMASNGQLRLKLDGEPTDTNTLDAEQRKRLIAILTQIRPWLEAPKASAPHPAAPRPASHPQEAPPAGTRPSPTPQPTPAPAPISSAPAPKPASPRVIEDDDDNDIAPSMSIVAQIDSVLQARLVGTPLADKGIRLQESLDGGVLVWVGIQKFEGVDDVPDETIKAALKGAIAEWENKYTPGL